MTVSLIQIDIYRYYYYNYYIIQGKLVSDELEN